MRTVRALKPVPAPKKRTAKPKPVPKLTPGDELRAELREIGITQSELARLTNCGTVTVFRWVSDARAVPHWLPSWLAMYRRLKDLEQT
jgi:hypothetical protein